MDKHVLIELKKKKMKKFLSHCFLFFFFFLNMDNCTTSDST